MLICEYSYSYSAAFNSDLGEPSTARFVSSILHISDLKISGAHTFWGSYVDWVCVDACCFWRFVTFEIYISFTCGWNEIVSDIMFNLFCDACSIVPLFLVCGLNSFI